MDEASKTQKIRGPEFARQYFSGKVIDIGSGKDLVTPQAEPFDKQHGDANHVLQHLPARSYDCVHSAHCLEHMFHPDETLREWWELVRPGGHLIVIVPHEDLYEQGIWPSIFNLDHKATFRLDKAATWSPVSYDMMELARSLPEANVVSAVVHDVNYDHSLRVQGFPQERMPEYLRSSKVRRHMRRSGLWRTPLWHRFQQWVNSQGIPIDQTLGDATAQIQIVVQKCAS